MGIIYEAEVTSLILNVVAILITSLKTMYFLANNYEYLSHDQFP